MGNRGYIRQIIAKLTTLSKPSIKKDNPYGDDIICWWYVPFHHCRSNTNSSNRGGLASLLIG